MDKERKINKIILGVNVLLVIILYSFNYFYCTGTCYVQYEDIYTKPLFAMLLGFLPTAIWLQFFSRKIILLWMKHVGWLTILAIYFVFSMDPYSSDILSLLFSQENTAYFWMMVLFVVTVIYTIIVHRREKWESGV